MVCIRATSSLFKSTLRRAERFEDQTFLLTNRMMFACIFFYEDMSLSVVGQKSKKLELMNSFKEGEKVKMNWGKSGMFSGCIVKVHETEELLNEEAIKAEKKILRGKHYDTNEGRVEALINYFKNRVNKAEHQGKNGKRERTATERAKESKEQDLELSPKKKKKNQKENEKGKKMDHEKCKETGKEKSKDSKGNKSGKEDTMRKALNPKEKEKQEKRAESNVELLAAKEILASSLCSQFGDLPERASSPAGNEDTPLTSTWSLCHPDLTNTSSQLDLTIQEDRPLEKSNTPAVPLPVEVVQLFELMLKPSVQDYMQAVVKQFKSGQSESCVNSQMADRSYVTLDQEIRMPPMITQTWTPYTNYTQPPPWSTQDTCISEQTPQTTLDLPTLKTPTKQSTADNTQFQHFTTLQDNNVISTPQSFMATHTTLPQNTQTQSLQSTNTDPLYMTNTIPFENAVTQSVQNTNTLQNTVTQPVQNMTLMSAQSTTSPIVSQQNTLPATPNTLPATPNTLPATPNTLPATPNTLPATPRRSPRKHASSTEDSDSHMTKLLAHQNLKVRRESLRKAKDAAKKAHPTKMAFTLTAKLLQAIFSWEELAFSRGQGLKSKEGDQRPVLDNSKMDVLKEYVSIWCSQNNGSFSEKSVNDAVTEQVSYARKKIKNKGKKPEDK